MKHFYIIANPQKDINLVLTQKIQQSILKQGGTCGYQINRKSEDATLCQEEIPKETECILVVGGDGTLLRVARDLVKGKVPFIGVNTGHVGYLCELEGATVMAGVEKLLLEENPAIEKRMLLEGRMVTEKIQGSEQLALNDIVIHRSGLLQIVDLIIYVNGEYLNTYSADGIIIATPTGSTAYSMSAGGPIVDPRANLILITPISPHSLSAKSIVLGADDEITIEIGKRRIEKDERVEVAFDGDHFGELAVGDKIIIKRGKSHTRILKLGKLSFLERLAKKLQEYT
ncbi:MAG: NAD(+)/NADH kinase [Lachnospiraceae bacterium]